MAVTWTEEQKRVIEVRDQDVLVSAAAGSGKTAVLVERIISRITDPVHPVDIDRMLVVTFTNAAASEMRERIRDALEQRAEEAPENVHLQRQLVLIHHANITTIHSFCLHVLRSHFHMIGLDPAFRIADEGECRLLEQDTVKEILDEAYEQGKPEFHDFLERLATGRNDDMVEELILQLYHFSLGHPWPDEWLEECCRMYEQPHADGVADCDASVQDADDVKPQPWLDAVVQDVRSLLHDIRDDLHQAIRIAGSLGGPHQYLPVLESDEQMLQSAFGAKDYDALAYAFGHLGSFARLPVIRDKAVMEELKTQVQEIRNNIKKEISDIRDRYFYEEPDVLRQEFYGCADMVRMLTELTEAFSEHFSRKKTEKNLLDFGDLEHLALKILLEQKEDRWVPSAAAQEYASAYEEIMTDEYQDSNLVQELILDSISGAGRGAHNRFMVGDVKQSIYRFRLARPELFMEKYRTYVLEEQEQCCRIDLHKNFRSRPEVLEGVNYIFRQIMTSHLGGIVYDDDAALYPGAAFAEGNDPEFLPVEFTLLEQNGREEGSKQEEEARLVGKRILEIVGKKKVWDKELEAYRPASWRDIVILLRTVSGWAEPFQEVLGSMGIPCFTGSQTGYFSAAEVRTVLSYLQILDNPIQDIPLAGVMRSAIGGFTDEELALIRARTGGEHFYECCMEFRGMGQCEAEAEDASSQAKKSEPKDAGISVSQEHTEAECIREVPVTEEYTGAEHICKIPVSTGNTGAEQTEENTSDAQAGDEIHHIREKLDQFFAVYDCLRAKTPYTPVHLLLWEIFEVTGYGAYVSTLPAGRQRMANLDMLVEKAIAYEATSYRGLYHFVRYIENLKKYEVDYGEANVIGESEDTVRIMSIHKSKGLEFPIVFVCGMAKKFNESDARSRIVLHPDLGIGCDYVDPEKRLKSPNLLKKVIQRRISQENLGEELRILYVAMTRAKEKLILTGTVTDFGKAISAGQMILERENTELTYSDLSSAACYLDWVLPAILHHPDAEIWSRSAKMKSMEAVPTFADAAADEMPDDVSHTDGIDDGYPCGKAAAPGEALPDTYIPQFLCIHALTSEQKLHSLLKDSEESLRLQRLLELDLDTCYDEQAAGYLDRVFHLTYPYEKDRLIRGKLSVSELKRMSQAEAPEESEQLYPPEEVVPLIPKFCGGQEVLTGAARGTVYHSFLQVLDFSKKEPLEIQLEELIKCGKMTREESKSLNLADIRRFLETDIGKRMCAAAKRGTLFREQPFVIGVSADSVDEEWNPEETVLIQGIIDAFFYEEDENIVLLDYKTDRVSSPKTLIEKYRPQLDYYGMALERLTGRKVKRTVIYSFHLGREIIL